MCVTLPPPSHISPSGATIVCMEQCESAAALLESVREQEVQFEQLTRALEEERRRVGLPATSPSALGHPFPHIQVTRPPKYPPLSQLSHLKPQLLTLIMDTTSRCPPPPLNSCIIYWIHPSIISPQVHACMFPSCIAECLFWLWNHYLEETIKVHA